MKWLYILGFSLALFFIVGLLGATLYANKGYPWPTSEELKTEMVLVENEYPGLLHSLLTVENGYGTRPWREIEDTFGLIDWDTWPWKDGAFYRQFNAPGWVEFFDSYELIPAVVMCALGFIAFRFWRKTEEIRTQPKSLTPQTA